MGEDSKMNGDDYWNYYDELMMILSSLLFFIIIQKFITDVFSKLFLG